MSEAETRTDEVLGTGTVLNELLGDHPRTRILIVLLSKKRTDLNITQIAEFAGLDRSTVYNHIDELLKTNVIEQTRTVGQSKMYSINRDNTAAEKLAELEWALIED